MALAPGLVLGTCVILLLQDCDRVLQEVCVRNYHAINSTLEPCEIIPNTPYLGPISLDHGRLLIAACSTEARGVCVSASASADLRVSAAARRGAAAYGVASRCFWKARTHGCLLSESEGERSEDVTLCRISR